MAGISATTNLYNNNIIPYEYSGEKPMAIFEKNQGLNHDQLTDMHPIGKLAIADTFHDLAQSRDGYDPGFFNGTILKNILNFKKTVIQHPDSYYKHALGKMFENTVGVSHLEPSVNAYIENVFGLQPAYEEITFDDILSHPFSFQQQANKLPAIPNSNGTLKITVPSPYKSFTHYLTKFGDETSYRIAQEGISSFIKNYLFQGEKEEDKPEPVDVAEIRFLFDAGANQIGKIFRYPNSGGIRYNAMACTADSASSSDSTLDPSRPNEYEDPGPTGVVKVTSNFYSHGIYDIHFRVNDGCKFGENGTKCFSVNFSKHNEKRPIDFVHYARFFFGSKKDTYEENEPCGSEGASVSHIGKTMENLEELRNDIKLKNNLTNIEQATLLNSVKNDHTYNSSCIPVGDSRFLKLFEGGIISSEDEINNLDKLLADYKRTGDYEQSLTLRRTIVNHHRGMNTLNYTFTSVDLLSTLFARLIGIPSIYQVGTNGTITLYKNTSLSGSPAEIEAQMKKAEEMKQAREAFVLAKMWGKLAYICESPFPEILETLKNAGYTDYYTKIQIDKIVKVFNPILVLMEKKQMDNKVDIEQNYRYLEQYFPSILKPDLKITMITSVINLTLPYLNPLIIKKRRSTLSTDIEKLTAERKNCKDLLNQLGDATDTRNLQKIQIRSQRIVSIDEEIHKILKNIYLDEEPLNNGIIAGGKNAPKQNKTVKKFHQNAVTKSFFEYNNKVNMEILDILKTVMNRSNFYLKDIVGVTDKVVYTVLILDLKQYSNANTLFLSSLLFYFMSTLQVVCSDNNLDISVLFVRYKILVYFLFFLSATDFDEGSAFYSEYSRFYEIHHSIVTKTLKPLIAQQSQKSVLALALFAQVGFDMGNFHIKDFFLCKKKRWKEVDKLNGKINEKSLPIQSILSYELESIFKTGILKFQTYGVLMIPGKKFHDTRNQNHTLIPELVTKIKTYKKKKKTTIQNLTQPKSKIITTVPKNTHLTKKQKPNTNLTKRGRDSKSDNPKNTHHLTKKQKPDTNLTR